MNKTFKQFAFKEPDLLPVFLLALCLLFITRRFLDTSLLFEEINLVSALSTLFVLLLRNNFKSFPGIRKCKEGLIIFLAVSFLINALLLNIDRSRSFYVLSWVANGQISVLPDENDFKIKSLESLNASGVYQRVEENKARGFITIKGDEYALTFAGKVFLDFTNLIATTYKLKNWEINKY